MNDVEVGGQKRPRSPSYPSIPLGKAVERAEVLYKNEGKYLAPIDSIIAHWGYTSRSGRALRQLAALKKFGLTIEEGSRDDRQIKLSPLGLFIVMPDSPERGASLKKAAMAPAIHKELRDKYSDGLPSDSTVRWYLKSERGFTESAANELVAEYRATMEFAGLDGPQEEPAENGDTVEDADDRAGDTETSQSDDMANNGSTATPPAPATPPPPVETLPLNPPVTPDLREISIPLPGTTWVKVVGAFPISEGSWDQMMAMLTAMKPGLTHSDNE